MFYLPRSLYLLTICPRLKKFLFLITTKNSNIVRYSVGVWVQYSYKIRHHYRLLEINYNNNLLRWPIPMILVTTLELIFEGRKIFVMSYWKKFSELVVIEIRFWSCRSSSKIRKCWVYWILKIPTKNHSFGIILWFWKNVCVSIPTVYIHYRN